MAEKMAETIENQIATNQLVQPHEIVNETETSDDRYEKEHHIRKQAFKSDLMKVIDQADVIIEVLDARDPENTRNLEAEQYCLSKKKPFVLLLNKIDLIPAEVAKAWCSFYKQMNIPCILFKCPVSISKGSVRYANAATGMTDRNACVGSFELKHLVTKIN